MSSRGGLILIALLLLGASSVVAQEVAGERRYISSTIGRTVGVDLESEAHLVSGDPRLIVRREGHVVFIRPRSEQREELMFRRPSDKPIRVILEPPHRTGDDAPALPPDPNARHSLPVRYVFVQPVSEGTEISMPMANNPDPAAPHIEAPWKSFTLATPPVAPAKSLDADRDFSPVNRPSGIGTGLGRFSTISVSDGTTGSVNDFGDGIFQPNLNRSFNGSFNSRVTAPSGRTTLTPLVVGPRLTPGDLVGIVAPNLSRESTPLRAQSTNNSSF